MADKTLASLVFPGLPDRYVVPDNSVDIEQIKEDLSSKVSTVNGTAPDANGNVEVGDSVPTAVRLAIYALFNSAAYVVTGLTDEIAIVQAYAAETTAITLNRSTLAISGATTALLTATTTPSGGAVFWESSNEAVATVDSNGLVTGVSNGTVKITATSGNKHAICTVTVGDFAYLTEISAVYTPSEAVYPTTSLDDLKSDLVVLATYSDDTTETIASENYILSGTLEPGTTCTITVIYNEMTCVFTVDVLSYVYHAENLVFDGNNYINTGVYLNSAENINKDFELECVISVLNFDTNDEFGIIVASMYEVSPYPGFTIRAKQNTREIAIGRLIPFSLGDVITIRREGGYLKAYINGVDTGASKGDSAVFDSPVTLGCEFDRNGNPYRYAKGAIDHITIKWT